MILYSISSVTNKQDYTYFYSLVPSYEEATKDRLLLIPTLVQPGSGRYIHQIPDEIQPGIPSRQFIIIEKCPACGVSFISF